MFIMTTRLTRRKIAAAVVVIGLLLGIIIFGVASCSRQGDGEADTPRANPMNMKLTNNDERCTFLTDLGWEVDSKPVDVTEVRLPDKFDDLFEEYNTMQRENGFDLSKIKGRKVLRCTYTILNYPTGEKGVMINLLLYKDKVVGGDICSLALDGFMYGLCARGQIPAAEQPPEKPFADGTVIPSADGTTMPPAGDGNDPSADSPAGPPAETMGDIPTETPSEGLLD